MPLACLPRSRLYLKTNVYIYIYCSKKTLRKMFHVVAVAVALHHTGHEAEGRIHRSSPPATTTTTPAILSIQDHRKLQDFWRRCRGGWTGTQAKPCSMRETTLQSFLSSSEHACVYISVFLSQVEKRNRLSSHPELLSVCLSLQPLACSPCVADSGRVAFCCLQARTLRRRD